MPVHSLDSEEAEEDAHSEGWDLETFLDHVGVGRFQWMALATCGLANAADAVEILAVSLVVPAAESDLSLTAAGKSALSSCIFLGMLVGGLVWGPMGDVLGRRTSLTVSLLLNAAFGLLSAAARNVVQMVLLRLVAGVGVGGSVPVVFSFLAELLPAQSRGKFMVGLAAHWMVGSIYSAGLGWALIPAVGWRWFLVVASLPAWLSAAANMLLMPESPRHLLVHGRVAEAEKALRHMAGVNRRSLPGNVRLVQHEGQLGAAVNGGNSSRRISSSGGSEGSRKDVSGMVLGTEQPAAGSRQDKDVLRAAGSSGVQHSSSGGSRARVGFQAALGQGLRSSGATMRQMLRLPLRSRFLPLLVAWLAMCGGWYSTVLWIPEYFKARGAGDASLYAQTFAVAAANLPGNIASIFMVDCLGRRWTACLCLAGSCACALLFAAAPAAPIWSVIAAAVFNAISVGGWNALDLLSAELFPTEVRSTAMGMLGAAGRLASFATTFLAGALMQVRLWLPLVVAAGMLAAGSVAMLLLPETALQPLEDTIQDAAAGPRGSSFSAGRAGRGLGALAGRADALRLELQSVVARSSSGAAGSGVHSLSSSRGGGGGGGGQAGRTKSARSASGGGISDAGGSGLERHFQQTTADAEEGHGLLQRDVL